MTNKKPSVFEQLKTAKVSLATGTLALFTLSLAILDNMPSVDVEGQSVLSANIFAVVQSI